MSAPHPARRTSTWRTPAAAALIAGAQVGLALAGAKWLEPRWLHIRQFRVTLPHLPAGLDGARLAFLTDTHIGGPGPNTAVTSAAIDRAVAWEPDLILLGGDFFDDGLQPGQGPDWSRLADCAPTFGVLGNHDFSAGVSQVYAIIETLESAGVQMLVNDSRTISVRSGELAIIGVADPFGERDDLPRAMAGVEDDADARLLLAHAPMIVDQLRPGDVTLALAGHTHGSQIRLSPFRFENPLDISWWMSHLKRQPHSRYQRGFFWVRGTLLFVGSGLGTTSLGLRFFAPPELALFTLHRGLGDPSRACDATERFVAVERVERQFVRG